MAYDLVTWSPAVGGVGADRYDPPADTKMLAGDSSGFTSPCPAIAELNASSDWNQVVGAVRRRIFNQARLFGKRITAATNATPIVITSVAHGLSTGLKIAIDGVLGSTSANGFWTVTKITNDTFSLDTSVGSGAYVSGGGFLTATAQPAYFVADTKITAAQMTTLRSAIDNMRQWEGLAAFSYATPIGDLAAGKKIKGAHIADFRNALQITGTLTIVRASFSGVSKLYSRTDNPYLTPTAESLSFAGGSSSVGISGATASPPITRARILSSYAVPEWLNALTSARVGVQTTAFTGTMVAEGWLSNTDDYFPVVSGYAGQPYHFDTALGTFDETIFTMQYLTVSNADVLARAGTGLSVIYSTQDERLGSAVLARATYTLGLDQLEITI